MYSHLRPSIYSQNIRYLSLTERLRKLEFTEVTRISFFLVVYFVTLQRHSINRFVVSACNVGIIITHIFASFVNFQLDFNYISLQKLIISSTSANKMMTEDRLDLDELFLHHNMVKV